MIKFLIGAATLTVLAVASHYLLPWWAFVLMAMLVGFGVNMHGGLSFLCGFSTMFLLWGIQSWWIDSANGGQLSAKMGEVLQMGSGTTVWWIVMLLGGLLGGLGMLTGKMGYEMLWNNSSSGGGGGRSRYRNRYR